MSDDVRADTVLDHYVDALRGELRSLGVADAEEVLAEVRSLLAEAAGGDADAAAREVARSGDPAAFAAEVLASRGLDAATGLDSGEWWRLGIAATIDIVIGLSVPAAAIILAATLATASQSAGGKAAAIAAAVASLSWPWFAWSGWRTGGSPSTGLGIAGLTVVRAAGARKVVRATELERFGIAPHRPRRLAAALSLAVAACAIALAGAVLSSQAREAVVVSVLEWSAGPEAAQKAAARTAADALYGAVLRHDATGGLVTGDAASDVLVLESRADARALARAEVREPVRLSAGVWRVRADETGVDGSTRQVDLTVAHRITPQADGAIEGDWVVTAIRDR